MIVLFLLQVLISGIGIIFWPLPTITTLPTIGGYDIDSALVSGMGELNAYAAAVWPLQDVFVAVLVLFSYYGLKMILKLVLGSHAPGSHG